MARQRRQVKWRWLIPAAGAVAVAALLIGRRPSDADQPASAPAPRPAGLTAKAYIPFEDARAILAARPALLPPDLAGKTPIELEAAWPEWVRRHDAQVRGRLERGDEDSIVNLWLYGTTFTSRTRATERDLADLADRGRVEALLVGRLGDLVAGLASPGANERLQFARRVVERQGIDPATATGQDQARRYLAGLRERVIADNARYRRDARSAGQLADERAKLGAYAMIYRDRGLSSDSSIPIDFAIEQSFAAAKAQGRIGPGSIRRVAIIGPGLDFTDKAEGHDFYPVQTIQPFAIIDSLLRHGLAAADALQVVTFDLSPRVNYHLERMRERARAGDPYVLQLPLGTDDRAHAWSEDLVSYWRQFGDRIGAEVPAMPAPSGAGVRVRAVRVRPEVVGSITPRDLNAVLERPQPLKNGDRFDLVIATNVFVYYDAFEQALALANVTALLRPDGFLLTNYAVAPAAPMEPTAGLVTTAYWDRQRNFDMLFWYRRR